MSGFLHAVRPVTQAAYPHDLHALIGRLSDDGESAKTNNKAGILTLKTMGTSSIDAAIGFESRLV